MKARCDFDYTLLSTFLKYDPDTGKITWIHSRGKSKGGAQAGSVGNMGYRKITLSGRTYIAHRLAWCLHYKEGPPEIIDHINHDKDDNRICNLRDGTKCLNQQNQMNAHKRNKTSKYLGVSMLRGQWRAKIYHAGKYYFLGYHESEEAAAEAYREAKRKIHQGCRI